MNKEDSKRIMIGGGGGEILKKKPLKKSPAWFNLIIGAAAIHYAFLLLFYHGFLTTNSEPTRSLNYKEDVQQLKKVVEQQEAMWEENDLQQSQDIEQLEDEGDVHQPTNARFIVGIETSNNDEEQKRRKLLRSTYLSYYEHLSEKDIPNWGSDEEYSNHICKLVDIMEVFKRKKRISNKFKDCKLAYTFVMKVNSTTTTSSIIDPSEIPNAESDVIYLNEKMHDQNPWLDYSIQTANELSFDYIAWIKPDIVFIPSLFLESTRYLPTATSSSLRNRNSKVMIYGETNVAHRGAGCNNCFYEDDAKRLTGRMYFMSLDVAKAVTPSATGPTCHVYDHDEKPIQSCIQRHIPQTKVWDLGHYYQEPTLSGYQFAWDQYMNATHAHQQILSSSSPQQTTTTATSSINPTNTSLTYITAKFGRNRMFAKEVTSTKNLVVANTGLPPSHVIGYDDFPNYITQDVRWEQHLEFMQDESLSPLGAGFWFWRGPILEHHLSLVNDGDFIILSNVDVYDHLRWLPNLLRTMVSRGSNLALYRNNFQENNWSKRDVYELLCPGKFVSNDKGNQYWSGLVILRKSSGTVAFVKEWSRLMSNYRILNDEKSILPEYPEFNEHRRDQSILSLLLKCKYKEPKKEEFVDQRINDLGWFRAYTFELP